MSKQTVFITLCVCATMIACASIIAQAGPIDPPAGPVGSTYKTLDEVEARRPIDDTFAPGSATARHRISSAGSYYLTGPLTVSDNVAAIEILVPNVTIDLNGYTISASTLFGSPTNGVHVTDNAVNGAFTLRNGTIRGFAQQGVWVESATPQVRLEGVTVLDCNVGAEVSSPAIVEGCVFSSNTSSGLVCGSSAIVTGCIARLNGGDGLRLSDGGVMKDCVVSQNSGDGLRAGAASGGSAVVRSCASDLNGGVGIVVHNGIVEGCSSRGNGEHGIATATGFEAFPGVTALIRGNLCIDNDLAATGDSGILLYGTGCFASDNLLVGNSEGVLIDINGDGGNGAVRNHIVGCNTVGVSAPGNNSAGSPVSAYGNNAAWNNFVDCALRASREQGAQE